MKLEYKSLKTSAKEDGSRISSFPLKPQKKEK